MKQLIVVLLLLSTIKIFSQTELNKHEWFDYFGKPSPTNELSLYFRENINLELLKAIKFKDTIEDNKRIILSFQFTKNLKIISVKANSQYGELNNEIEKAFRNYDLKKIKFPDNRGLYNYKLQIISSFNNSAIINCSTFLIYDKEPVYDGCDLINNHSNLSTCNYRILESFIADNMNPEIIQDFKSSGQLILQPKFTIDVKGEITANNSNAPTKVLKEELDRVLKLLPKPIAPATRNGKPISREVKSSIVLFVEPKDSLSETLKSEPLVIEYPKTTDLSIYFKNNLKTEDFKSLSQKSVRIYFELDKKGRYINVWNNIKDRELNLKLCSILKRYPVANYNITNKDLLNIYSYTLLEKLEDKNIYRFTSELCPETFRFPIVKGCEKSKSSKDLSKCNGDSFFFFVKRNFNTNLRNKTKLSNSIWIKSSFKIDSLGKIVDLKVSSPNPYFANEIEKLLNDLPYKIEPALKNGEPSDCYFNFPIRFKINRDFDAYNFVTK
ncbi:hypothetical protein ACGK9U_06130 [Mariniflexile sp. HNIBRBA6329]|uniref:hypothetical protein n=1 Tax=Mariniflexile sp. HNIBRBA6329 TaxID=3373088 RepID=UPI0037463414